MDIADPRGAREREKPVKVVCLFIVNADGQPIEPRIVSSTDSWASETMIKSFATRRFVPAKLNGVPVASLNSSEIKWGGEAARDHPSFENGLGIMGYRDR